MITTPIVLAGIAGIVMGYLTFRLLRNWGIAVITPLLIVATVAVLMPPTRKTDRSTVGVQSCHKLSEVHGLRVFEMAFKSLHDLLMT